MKLLVGIAFFLFLLLCQVNAQNRVQQTETLVRHAPFQYFFKKHPSLKEIRFEKNLQSDSLEIEMVEVDTSAIAAFNRFDLSKESDRYFYRKRFSPFVLPAALYTGLLHKEADVVQVSGTVRMDSIFFSIKQIFYPKDDEGGLFFKIEQPHGYAKGLHVMAQQMEAELSHFSIQPSDSTVMIRFILGKDGTLTRFTIEKGDPEDAYTKQLVALLQASGPWLPFETGGRKVKAYIRLFIRINPDKTYTLAME